MQKSKSTPPAITNVRNIKPRKRNRDLNAVNNNSRFVNREVYEKQRLKERTFGHIRHESATIDDPINPIKDKVESLSYSDDIDRFDSNIIDDHIKEKCSKIQKHSLKIQHLTQERIDRDTKRWNAMQTEFDQNEEKIKKLNPIKNEASMPYNPITLRYDDSLDGKRLEFQDQQSIYRAKLREKRLFEKQTCGYCPLTGTKKAYQNEIERPSTPSEIAKQ